ncbi:MAG: DegV family protein [Dehalococcoidales bacterium]|nr:DegV family protein [Dehalococcoidales bacterium]
MTFKIVTDSTADLPSELAKKLNIDVVPEYVRFGDKVYRDRVDISEDEFYQKLLNGPIHPSTTQPSPQDFADVYRKLSQEAEGIISIHLSSKLSGTYNSALQGKELSGNKCPIEVIDSQLLTMSLGLLVIEAANIAMSGKSMPQIIEEVKRTIPSIHFMGLLDTLKYLAMGGRIGKVQALLGSVLSVKPMLSIENGELVPVARVRKRADGIDKLFNFVKNATGIQDLAIVYNTTPDEALALTGRMDSLFPKERIRLAKLGPALGVHAGPRVLVVALREAIRPIHQQL